MLPILFDHSLCLVAGVQLQLSSVLLATIGAVTCTGGLLEVTLPDRATQLQLS